MQIEFGTDEQRRHEVLQGISNSHFSTPHFQTFMANFNLQKFEFCATEKIKITVAFCFELRARDDCPVSVWLLQRQSCNSFT